MDDLLCRFDNGTLIALTSVAGGLLVAVVAIVAGVWAKARRAELDATLKQEMIGRGMSADDIRTVLEAGSSRFRPKRP